MVIFKYYLDMVGEQYVPVHAPAKFIHVGLDPGGHICLWAEVSENQDFSPIRVCIVGTGDGVPTPKNGVGINHIGSVVDENYVWHVYVANHHEFPNLSGNTP